MPNSPVDIIIEFVNIIPWVGDSFILNKDYLTAGKYFSYRLAM